VGSNFATINEKILDGLLKATIPQHPDWAKCRPQGRGSLLLDQAESLPSSFLSAPSPEGLYGDSTGPQTSTIGLKWGPLLIKKNWSARYSSTST
jgi:hypothetical protein